MGIARQHLSDTSRELCDPASKKTGAKGKLRWALAVKCSWGPKPQTTQSQVVPSQKLPWKLWFNQYSPGAGDKQSTCQCSRCKRPGFNPWIGRIPWRKKWQRTPVFLPGESHGQRSLVGYSLWGCKESDRTEHWSPCQFLRRLSLLEPPTPSLAPPHRQALGTDKPDLHPASRLSTSWRGGALGRHKGICRGLLPTVSTWGTS